MMTNDIYTAVAARLTQAGAAHGVYEERELNGVYDQDWPDWYAAYLIEHGLESLLDRSITVAQLAEQLKSYDTAYRRERPTESWPLYYARRLVDRVAE